MGILAAESAFFPLLFFSIERRGKPGYFFECLCEGIVSRITTGAGDVLNREIRI